LLVAERKTELRAKKRAAEAAQKWIKR
jgi:hypothetical protein